jgi:hypothetical protein
MWFCAKCGELLRARDLVPKKCGFVCRARSVCKWRRDRREVKP